MSVFLFYAKVNIACVCILLLLLYSIKKLPTPLLKFTLFRSLILWHIAYFISDSAWALVNDDIIPKNVFSVLAVNYSNAIVLAITFYRCFVFAEMGTKQDLTKRQIQDFQYKLRIPIVLEAILLLASFVAFPHFWLDENLEPGLAYNIVLSLLPITYIFTAAFRGIRRGFMPENRENLGTYLVVASYAPGCLVAGSAQLFLAMTTPIFCFWCTIIILFVYLHTQNSLISTDPLTMLNNRNRLYHYLHQFQRDRPHAYVVMVDIDCFKQINDTYGHNEGDRALMTVSSALKRACEKSKDNIFLCRYGGDEFLIIAQTDDPLELVNKIRWYMNEENKLLVDLRPYSVEASIGYAEWDGQMETFKRSVFLADCKMYEAKRSV